jgi:ferric-dicitrate binding protein FerR (iron transport regulator)
VSAPGQSAHGALFEPGPIIAAIRLNVRATSAALFVLGVNTDSRVRLHWRVRTICSDGDSDADIVREPDRYNHTKVVIVDSTVGTLRIGGRFSATSPGDFIELINRVFPGRVVARTTEEDEIHLLAQK